MSWEGFIEQARRSLTDPDFDNRERVYKLQIAESLRGVLEAAQRGEDWRTELRRALGRSYGTRPFKGQYNLSRFSQHEWLYKLPDEHAGEARAVLATMLAQEDPVERFVAFSGFASDRADRGGAQPGSVLALGSVLNMAIDPTQLPPMKTRVLRHSEEKVGFPKAPDNIAEAYPHHLKFIDECSTRLDEAGIAVRDRLDVQSILWEWESASDSTGTLHVLQRWSVERDPETVSKHRSIAADRGAVWWGRLGDPEGRAAIGAARLSALQSQLDGDTPTYVFLHRTGEVWRTRLMEIRSERPAEELELIPEYYRDVEGAHHLWLKLKDFEELAPDYAEKQLVMDGSADPDSLAKAFRGQQSFLYVRLGSEAEGAGSDALAASVAAFRADYPYNDHEKAEKAVESLALAATARPALSREALETPDWQAISPIFASNLYGNLGPAKSAPLNLIASGTDEDRQKFAEAIRSLLHGEGGLATRLDEFLDADLPGIRETAAMKLLSIAESNRVLHVFKVHGHNGKAELMVLPPVSLSVPDEGSTGELAVETNDLIRERLAPHFGDDCYGMTRYLYWLADQIAADGPGKPEEKDPERMDDLAKRLYLDESGWLEDAVDLLERKRQLILYGPPGTGKTFIALKLMKQLASLEGQREVVQFHPSYSYEDFVRGYRPIDRDGQLTYRIVEGPLLRLAERARKALESGDDIPHILLIDEINRGNLPRILGELLYLLEYRSEQEGVQLMYADDPDERFTLPKNLWIIGTMNTADRSIGLIDAALRRRFHFKSLFPGEAPIKGTLRRWLHDHTSADVADHAADHVDRLNERLMEQQGTYGENLKVGHSYFMEKDLDRDLFDRIWTSDVLPYLEEQLFGREVDVAKTFSLKALEAGDGSEAVTGEEAEAPADGAAEASGVEELLTDAGDGS